MTARFEGARSPAPVEGKVEARKDVGRDRDLERALLEEAMSVYFDIVTERRALTDLLMEEVEPKLPASLRARVENSTTKLSKAVSELWPKMKALEQLNKTPLPRLSKRKQ
jgi:hypothetical protein